jgi:hypothetical protein
MFNKFLIGILTFGLTAFILANTYEVVYNQDIPVVSAVQKMKSQSVINKTISYYQSSGSKQYDVQTGALGELDYLSLPTIDSRVYIGRERLINGEWYFRPNNVHYYPLNYDESGDIGDYLLYSKKSWRAIPLPESLQIGDDIQITNSFNKTTSFKIEDRQILPFNKPYVVSDSGLRQIIMIVEDQENSVYYIYTAR